MNIVSSWQIYHRKFIEVSLVVCNNKKTYGGNHTKYEGFRFPYLFTQTNMMENITSSTHTVTQTEPKVHTHAHIDPIGTSIRVSTSDLKLMPSNVGIINNKS